MITKLQWEGLSGKERWDIIVALRGPDVRNSDTLKWFTTAVIRYHASAVMRVGGLVNNHTPFVLGALDPHLYKPVGPRSWDLEHFFIHTVEAAALLHVPIYYLKCSSLLDIMVLNQIEAMQHIVNESQNPFTYCSITKEILLEELAFMKGIPCPE